MTPSPPSGTDNEADVSHSDTTRGGTGARGPRVLCGHSQAPLWSDSRGWLHPEQSRRMLVPSGCRRKLDSYNGQEAPKPSRVASLDPSGPREREGQGQGSSGVLPLRVVAEPRDLSTGRRRARRRRQNPGGGAPRSRQSLAGEPGSHPLSSHRQNRDTCREMDDRGAAPTRPTAAASRSARHSEGAGGAGGSWGRGAGGEHGLVQESQADREKDTS